MKLYMQPETGTVFTEEEISQEAQAWYEDYAASMEEPLSFEEWEKDMWVSLVEVTENDPEKPGYREDYGDYRPVNVPARS